MIQKGDLQRPAQVHVLDGYRRSWRTLWRRRPVYRLIFAGYIEQIRYSGRGGDEIVLVDAISRVFRRWVVSPPS